MEITKQVRSDGVIDYGKLDNFSILYLFSGCAPVLFER